MDLGSDSIFMFSLIFLVMFMHLLVASPASVCYFSVGRKTTEMEFFMSSKNLREIFEIVILIQAEIQGLFPSSQ